ncbi:MAG: TIGR00730 family Rossman fold protein [Zavarzinella sp.]|nr:TIGR00730 family Rossman fold protein [Zavarzinella sp.]
MRRVCVFCGSSPGARAEYKHAAAETGDLLARRGLGLVYGGGHVGLMGVLADAAMRAGGEVIGVITQALGDREVAHTSLTELHVVRTMHERKAQMAALSEAFLVLPGGIGTLEEFFEVWTWGQLGEHTKPVGIINTAGYYDGLIRFLDQAVAERFLKPRHREMLIVGDTPAAVLDAFPSYEPPAVGKWIGPSET